MDGWTITETEFAKFRGLLHRIAGIQLSPAKKALVCGRLARRLKHHGLASFEAYFRLLTAGGHADELQTAVDLLTTNETRFFREPKHFDFLRREVLARAPRGQTFRVWSAACSTGEEPYTLAMVLADALGTTPWEVVGSDLSTRVLARARTGHYPLDRAGDIPPDLLRKYCLRGFGSQEGTFLVDGALRRQVRFQQVNLNEPLPALGTFDVIFLRNVMIYFDNETKQGVVARLSRALRSGGYFIVGHSETLNGLTGDLEMVSPSVYRKTP